MSKQEKVAEGSKFLLESDLDPEVQESEDTETPPKEDTETPKEESGEKEDRPQEEAPSEEPREYKGIKVGDKVYPDEPALVAAYQSLEGTLGRQDQQQMADLMGQAGAT